MEDFTRFTRTLSESQTGKDLEAIRARQVGLPFLGPEHFFDPVTGDTFRFTRGGRIRQTGNLSGFDPESRAGALFLADATSRGQEGVKAIKIPEGLGSSGGGSLQGLLAGLDVSPTARPLTPQAAFLRDQAIFDAIARQMGTVTIEERRKRGFLGGFGGPLGGLIGGLIAAPFTGGLSLIPAAAVIGGGAALGSLGGNLLTAEPLNLPGAAVTGLGAGLVGGALRSLPTLFPNVTPGVARFVTGAAAIAGLPRRPLIGPANTPSGGVP